MGNNMTITLNKPTKGVRNWDVPSNENFDELMDKTAEKGEILVGDIKDSEFNVSNKLLKLDADAKIPLVHDKLASLLSAEGDIIIRGVAEPEGRPSNVGARVYRTSAQSIPNNTFSILSFDAERYDTHQIFDENAIGTRMAEISCSDPACFLCTLRIPGVASAYTHLNISTIFKLNVGTYVQVAVMQDSGNNLNVLVAPNCSEFAMQKIG